MTAAQEMLELAEKYEAAAERYRHMAGGEQLQRNAELVATALRSSALSLNEVGGERKI